MADKNKDKNKKPKPDQPKDSQPKLAAHVQNQEITEELRSAYLDYAMSVIVSRALPDLRDGLKPVQRRILWAMWSMGLHAGAKTMKSARIVGETMGKFHPHGDSAVYDALVRMAQDFSLRYPLIQGQGNFGNIDGDSAAAQRYTEAKLSKIAEEMLKDIEKDTVNWRPNYDNTRKEPEYLPAKLPNLILNGAMGIAVGMATSIPPHNLNEVVDALVYLIKHPNASTKDLMKFVPAPDFPTGGIIYGQKDLEEAYATGKGSITIRAKTDLEETKKGLKIIITEIPYQVVKSSLIAKIALLVQSKKIDGIRDIRDESDREGLRIVIELKSGVNPQRILNYLFKHTDLQKKFYFNMVALVDGIQPQLVSLKEMLSGYVAHRKTVVRRRTEFDLRRAEERAHILEGLAKALKEIDAVIATIKKSANKEEAHKNLVKKFKLSDIQATAILEMKLQTLASLETKKINDELKEKKKLIAELKDILAHPEKILGIISTELNELKKSFYSERKTEIKAARVKEFNQEDFIPEEEAVIILTHDGYIKRILPDSFRQQKRGGRGMIGFDLKEEDRVSKMLVANTHHNLLFFTNKGKVFQTKVYDVPETKRTAKGKLVHTFLSLNDRDTVSAMISYDPKELESKNSFLFMATKNGLVKKVPMQSFANVRRNGILAIHLKTDDSLSWADIVHGSDQVMIITANGQSIRFKEKDIRPMGRSAAGVKGITLKPKDRVVGMDIVPQGDSKGKRLLIVTANGFGKQTELKNYKLQKRGGSGIKAANITGKTGSLIAAQVVGKECETVIAFSANGQVIKTTLANIRLAGRATQGVKIMNLEKGDSLVGIVCF